VKSLPANLMASLLVVGLWGYFLIAAINDPDGGIKALWPIFGIANQLLAATALCLATTVLLKMALAGSSKGEAAGKSSSPAIALVTLVPLLWLLAVTGTASYQKIWNSDPRIGFLAQAEAMSKKLDVLKGQTASMTATALPAHQKQISQTTKQYGNAMLDAGVTGFFLTLVVAIFLISVREWILLLARKKVAELHETPPTWLPAYAAAEAGTLKVFSLFALVIGLARELSGEAALKRAEMSAMNCDCAVEINLLGERREVHEPMTRVEIYDDVLERRYNGVNRCC
jgi:carbon starvation protein